MHYYTINSSCQHMLKLHTLHFLSLVKKTKHYTHSVHLPITLNILIRLMILLSCARIGYCWKQYNTRYVEL